MVCITGDICPAGAYCPTGSIAPTLCDPGTYSLYEGNSEVADCIPCPAGYQCTSSGDDHGGVECDEGYYCESGTITQNLVCPPGT